MPQFIFPLDGVLRQREHVEEQRQRDLASVQSEMAALEAELRGMDQTVQASTTDLRDNHLVGRLDLAFLAAHRRYTLAMQRKALALAQQMAAVQVRLDAARRALAEAAKQRKVIEKLRENRKAEWAGERVRTETAALEEISAQIAYRNAVGATPASPAAAVGPMPHRGMPMKKLLQVLTLTLAINFLALLGGFGWLWQSGQLDRTKALAVKDVLFPKSAPQDATPDAAKAAVPAPATQPFVNLDALLARHAGKRAGEQVEVIQQSFDVQSAQLDRRKRELDALAEQVAREQKKLADAGAALEEAGRLLEQREKRDESQAGDKGFQDSLKLYGSMAPGQVKKVFMTLSEDTVVNYLQAMPPRSATRIVKEFKTKEELDLIHHVLEKMRQGGQGGQGGVAGAGGAGNPTPAGPGTEAKGPVEPKEPTGVIGPPAKDAPAPGTPADGKPSAQAGGATE